MLLNKQSIGRWDKTFWRSFNGSTVQILRGDKWLFILERDAKWYEWQRKYYALGSVIFDNKMGTAISQPPTSPYTKQLRYMCKANFAKDYI